MRTQIKPADVEIPQALELALEIDDDLIPESGKIVLISWCLGDFVVRSRYSQPSSCANSRVYSMKFGHEMSGGTP
jgi:hypothetical protein